MANLDMALRINEVLLPNPSTFERINEENATDRMTMGGELNTDFINFRRSWIIGWKLLPAEDYEAVYEMYRNQFRLNAYPFMQFDAYDLYIPVRLKISGQKIKYNGSLIADFSMIIMEKYAIS